MPRLALVAVVASLALGALVQSATATERAGSPVLEATSFVRAFLTGDPAACKQLAPAFAGNLRAVSLDCPLWVRRLAESEDYDVRETLQMVEMAASEVSIRWNAEWLPKPGAVDTLVRTLRAYDTTLRVRAGVGPGAARAAREGVVIVDRRTTKTRLVLHARARSGRVWTLVEAPGSAERISPSAVRGAALVDPVAPGSRVIAEGPGHSTVLTPLTPAGEASVIIGVDADGKVDLLLFGSMPLIPLGGDPIDLAAATADVAAAWSAPNNGALCALADGALRKAIDEDCDEANEFKGAAIDVTASPDTPTGTNAVLLDVSIPVDGVRVSIFNLVTRVGGRTVVHALYIDPVQLITAGEALAKLPI